MLIKVQKKVKDKKKRQSFLKNELKIRYYKYMRLLAINNRQVKNYINYQKLLSGHKTIITNYCYLTARGRGVLQKFRMSRHQIREKFKYLNGLTNSSW